MSTDMQPLFDYAALPEDVRGMVQEHTGEIRNLARRAAKSIAEIGERLIEVKAALGHGGFSPWLKDEFGWDIRTAQNFMRVAEVFKHENFSHLDIAPSALYALASGSTPEAIREEFMQRAQAGEAVSRKAVSERLEQHQQQFEQAPAVAVAVPPVSPPSTPVASPGESKVTVATPEPDNTEMARKRKDTPSKAQEESRLSYEGTKTATMADGTQLTFPAVAPTPMRRELRDREDDKAAKRFMNVVTNLIAALTAFDTYTPEDIKQIVESEAGRKELAAVRLARSDELLAVVAEKRSRAQRVGPVIDAAPLIEVLPPKKDDERTLETLN